MTIRANHPLDYKSDALLLRYTEICGKLGHLLGTYVTRVLHTVRRVWMGGGGTNVSFQLKCRLFVSWQLNFRPFVSYRLIDC